MKNLKKRLENNVMGSLIKYSEIYEKLIYSFFLYRSCANKFFFHFPKSLISKGNLNMDKKTDIKVANYGFLAKNIYTWQKTLIFLHKN